MNTLLITVKLNDVVHKQVILPTVDAQALFENTLTVGKMVAYEDTAVLVAEKAFTEIAKGKVKGIRVGPRKLVFQKDS